MLLTDFRYLRYLHCCARTQRCVQSCTNSVIVIDDILRPCTSSSVTLSSPLRSRCCVRTQRCVQACTYTVFVINEILRPCTPSSASLLSSPSSSLSSSFWRFWSWPQPSLPCWTVWLCALFYVHDFGQYVFVAVVVVAVFVPSSITIRVRTNVFFSFDTCGDNAMLSLRFPHLLAQRRGRYLA